MQEYILKILQIKVKNKNKEEVYLCRQMKKQMES